MGIRHGSRNRSQPPPNGKPNPLWKPGGESPNPGGRSSAAAEMARRIRERTNDGLELIDFALAVLRGGELPVPAGSPEGTAPKPVPSDPKSRMFALDWLSERGWGRAKQDLDILIGAVELTPEQTAMLEALRMSPHERRERIAELRARMLGAATDAAAVPAPAEPDDESES